MNADTRVQTVLGDIPSSELGLTLAHEHLWASFATYLWSPQEQWKRDLADAPVTADLAWALREDPFFVADNLKLDDVDMVVEELAEFTAAEGSTVIEVSNVGMGRDPRRLAEISRASGVNVVMGCGWYIEQSHGTDLREKEVDELAHDLINEIRNGADDTGIRPGIIGEIGVSDHILAGEARTLAAAARAHRATGLPITVHLDGWTRVGGDVLDLLEGEGVAPSAVVLGHMNPSGLDAEYQLALAQRGVWLAFDMTGMGYYYESHGGQAPSADEDARHIARLCDAGFAEQVLVSHDVFVKSMLTRHGGNGFAYIPRLFLPRLVRRHGISDEMARDLLVANPRNLFRSAARAVDPT